MRRRSGLMAVSVMRCSCLNGGWQSPILRQDAACLEAARILSPSKARALESKAAPGPGAFYRVSGFVQMTQSGPKAGRGRASEREVSRSHASREKRTHMCHVVVRILTASGGKRLCARLAVGGLARIELGRNVVVFRHQFFDDAVELGPVRL